MPSAGGARKDNPYVKSDVKYNPNPDILVWGLVTRINKNLCESRSCSVEIIQEITALDAHEVLLKLTTARRQLLAINTKKFAVQCALLKDMNYLDLGSSVSFESLNYPIFNKKAIMIILEI